WGRLEPAPEGLPGLPSLRRARGLCLPPVPPDRHPSPRSHEARRHPGRVELAASSEESRPVPRPGADRRQHDLCGPRGVASPRGRYGRTHRGHPRPPIPILVSRRRSRPLTATTPPAGPKGAPTMLLLAVILLLLWGAGMLTACTVGGLLHILLVVALVVVIL